jgi:CheY-like chemotaxis protein
MSGTILLVDDNPDDADLTRLALERQITDARIVHVVDGPQALEYLFAGPGRPDVRFIILDIKLPKIDGLQVLERIKADPRTRAIPVVILSSSNRDAEVARSFECGVNSYVVKPVQLEAYLERVAGLGRYWNEINRSPPRAG